MSRKRQQRIRAHLALHRYVSSSASPNEINYLKSIGLIPRSGKKNKGRRVKSPKHATKTAASKSERSVKQGLQGGLTGGIVGALLAPSGLKTRGGLASAAITGGGIALSNLLHNRSLRERSPARKKALQTASGVSSLAAVLGMYLAPFAVLKGANRASIRRGFASHFDERAIRKLDPKMHQSMVSSFRDAKAREAAKVIKFPSRAAKENKVPMSERAGQLLKFPKNPGLWKNSSVFNSFFDEVGKIARAAGYTLVGGKVDDSGVVEFAAPTIRASRVARKPRRSTSKATVESMGRAVATGSTTPLPSLTPTTEPSVDNTEKA